MDELKNVKDAILLLGKKIDEQNARLERLENASGVERQIKSEDFSSVRNEVRQLESQAQEEEIQQVGGSIDFPEEKNDKPRQSLEENIGIKWFSVIGITALFLGIALFVKYAFDNDWVSPAGRVIIGVIIGAIFIALGEKLIKKYSKYAQILSGGGIAVLYLSIFAAMNFYSLIGQFPAFTLMILITALGIYLSLRHNALSLMVVSTVGGFLTPYLVATGESIEIALFSYVLILNLAILFVAIFKKWRAINLIGFFSTVIIFSNWADSFYTDEKLMTVVIFLTLYFLVYSISSMIYNLISREKSTGVEQISIYNMLPGTALK